MTRTKLSPELTTAINELVDAWQASDEKRRYGSDDERVNAAFEALLSHKDEIEANQRMLGQGTYSRDHSGSYQNRKPGIRRNRRGTRIEIGVETRSSISWSVTELGARFFEGREESRGAFMNPRKVWKQTGDLTKDLKRNSKRRNRS